MAERARERTRRLAGIRAAMVALAKTGLRPANRPGVGGMVGWAKAAVRQLPATKARKARREASDGLAITGATMAALGRAPGRVPRQKTARRGCRRAQMKA